MTKTALFAAMIALSCSINAQPTFEKFFPTGTSFRFTCHELTSGNLFTGLGCALGVSLLNDQGSLLNTRCYMPIPMSRVSSLSKLHDERFLFASSYRSDSCALSGSLLVPRRHPSIGVMDTLGNVLEYRFYEMPQGCQNSVGDFTKTADDGVVAWGSDTSFFAIRVNADLSARWGKRFTGQGGFHFIKELPGGDLLAGINMETAGAVVARMDAEGNFLWCKSYMRPKGMMNDAIIESDSSFIITGYTDSTQTNIFTPLPSTFQPKLFMMKLDGNGEVQWCRGYMSSPYDWNTPKPFRSIKTMDGNYLTFATLGNPGYNQFFRPLLIKTDTNGDTLWTSSVGRPGFGLFGMDLLECSDKGLVMTGYIWGDLPQGNSSAAYVFKADSLGRFPCWGQTHVVQVVDLFPTDSSFTLTSVDGLLEQPAVANDTLFPFNEFDGCTFTTGMPTRPSRSRAMSIRPNPNTGRFTVEFQDPLIAESYYSVYDALGKLLLQRAAAHGQRTQEVDLGRYGPGTYVIKFTDAEGTCYERVVVE